MVKGRLEAAGRRPRKMELGRCVATIAWIRPRRLAKEDAKTLPMVETNLVGMVNKFEEKSRVHNNIPSRRHDAPQFALGKRKFPLKIEVDEAEGHET
jgi:hypothetical protein